MFGFPGSGSKSHYWLTLLSGLVESLFFSGMAFGWASLVFVLKVDGYFAGYCVNTTRDSDPAVYIDCMGQDKQFSLVMCVALITNTLLRFPIGCVFDHFGTTATRLIAISLYTTGALFITLLKEDTVILLYPAMSCLIISGTILHITNAQVGNLFHLYRSTIITVYNGAFDSSAAVFFVIKLLHERGVSLFLSFLILTSCSLILLLRTFFLMPRGHIPYPLPESYTYGVKCPGSGEKKNNETEEMKEQIDLEKKQKEHQTEETKPEHKPKQEEVASFQSCVLSWLFLWHLVWVITILFCQFIFLSNVNPMLNRLANDDQTLVSGVIMDRHKKRPLASGETSREADLNSSCLSLFLTSLQCFLFCVCFTCPILPLQYCTFILQVLNSSFFYGGHQAFISIAFPMSHFGKISGIAMSIAALGLLLQVPILHLIQHQLHGDPLYVNVAVTLLSLLALIHPIHVSRYCKKLKKQRTCTTKEANEQLLAN